MNRPFTALATPEAEERVLRDMERVLAVVSEALPAGSVIMVGLTGGFGRGEGGMTVGPGGEVSAFNDYDLVVVTNGAVPAGPLLERAASLARELGVDFVDFGVFPADILPRVPRTVFWYELREGHRVLSGDPGTLLTIPPVDPGALPLIEGTRLLLNRGLSLLWAWLHLEEAGTSGRDLDPEPLRFSVNAIHKTVLAVGDAALIRAGRYDLSYRERAARVGGVPLPFTEEAREEFLLAHGRATQFKLFPAVTTAPRSDLARWWTGVRDWHETALRWIEEARLERTIGPWSKYPSRLAAESVQEGLRHPRRWLRERGGASIVKGWSRHFLDAERAHLARLPFLLYSAGPDGLDRRLLDSGLSAVPAGDAALRTQWRDASLDLLSDWHP